MSLFEWFGENYFPGESGTIEKRTRLTRNVPRYWVLINIVISLAIIIGIYYWIFQGNVGTTLQTFLIISGAIIVYCVIGFFVNPKPNYNNIGIGNTPINHPFKISDNINRSLIILNALLWPGFFIARSFIEFFTLIKHGRSVDMR